MLHKKFLILNEDIIDEVLKDIIKQNDEIDKTLPMSYELDNLLKFIYVSLAKELPTLTIDLEYFILGVFTQRQSSIYKRLDSCLVSSAVDAIYSAFYKTVSSKALSAIKSNRKVVLDSKFTNILIKAEEEA